MGALMRATRMEVEELAAGDPHWWPGLCAAVAEGGLKAALAEKDSRGWSWGALWRWIVEDADRYGEYTHALQAFTQLKSHERLDIVDAATPEDVQVAKLRSETRRDFAAKVDRERWGEKVDYIGVALDPLSEMLKEISERKMAALKEPRVIEASHTIIPERPAVATVVAEEGEV